VRVSTLITDFAQVSHPDGRSPDGTMADLQGVGWERGRVIHPPMGALARDNDCFILALIINALVIIEIRKP